MATTGLGTLSIDGLVSNLKTSELIAKLMDLERRPIRLLQRKQQNLQNQNTTWSDLNARLLALLGMVSPLTTVPAFQLKSATSSNTSLLTASATSSAIAASYTARVQQLALAHSVGTDSHLTTETSNSLRTMLTNEGIPGAALLTAIEIITIRVGSTSKSITVDTTTDKLSDLLTDINTQSGDLVTASVINDSPTTQKLVLTSKTAGRAGEVYFTDSANGLLQKLGFLDNGTTITGIEYTNDFSNAATIADFAIDSGVWAVTGGAGGALQQTNELLDLATTRLTAFGLLSPASNTYDNVEATVTMNVPESAQQDNAELLIRYNSGVNTGYRVSISADEPDTTGAGPVHTKNTIQVFDVNTNALLASYSYVFQNNTNYTVTARAEGDNVRVLLNGQQVIDFTNVGGPTSGQVALATDKSDGNFDNLEVRRISAKNVLQRAQDAVFTLNNIPIVSSSNTNTTAINGVTLNLVSAAPTTDVSLTVAADTASVRASIQNFITQYNDLVNFFREQTQFSEGQKTVGSLFADGLLINIQSQLQNLMLANADPLQRTEFVGIGDGNLGDIFGDFTLKNEITDVSDVTKVTAGSTEYVVRREGWAVAGGGNQVEVRLNGQLRFFDNTGAAAVSNGQTINVTYMPAEIVPGTGGVIPGTFRLSKTISNNLNDNDIVRIYADPTGLGPGNDPGLFTVMTNNAFKDVGFTPRPDLPDGYYVEVDTDATDSGSPSGSLRFFRKFLGGDVTPIGVDAGSVKAVYKGVNDYGSLAQIGVSVNDITDPTLKVDSTKLDAALSTNLQGVQELFNEYTQSVATALNDYLNKATASSTGTVAEIQNGIKDEIDSIQDRINDMEEVLTFRQTRLQKQFAKMEATLGLLQAQGVFLQQQVSKLPQGFTLPT